MRSDIASCFRKPGLPKATEPSPWAAGCAGRRETRRIRAQAPSNRRIHRRRRTGVCWRSLAGEGWPGRFVRNPPSHSRTWRGIGPTGCWRLLAGEGWPGRFARNRPSHSRAWRGIGPTGCWRLLAGEGWPGRFARNRPSHSRAWRGIGPIGCWRPLAGEGWPSQFARKRPPTVDFAAVARSKACGRPAVPGEGAGQAFRHAALAPAARRPA